MNAKPDQRPVPGAGQVGDAVRDLLEAAEDPEDTSLKRPAGHKDVRLPHERDEAPDPLDASETTPVGGPRQVIEQAASDLSRGLVDTDLHGSPNVVPGPGAAPEESPGAEVPDRQGIDRKSLAGRSEAATRRPGKDATHT